jgi:hypothetical protein
MQTQENKLAISIQLLESHKRGHALYHCKQTRHQYCNRESNFRFIKKHETEKLYPQKILAVMCGDLIFDFSSSFYFMWLQQQQQNTTKAGAGAD